MFSKVTLNFQAPIIVLVGETMPQGDRIKAVLAAFSEGADGAIADITGLIAKIRAGAPDLLPEAELAAFEARAAALKSLVDSTDPATVETDPAPAPDPPVDEV